MKQKMKTGQQTKQGKLQATIKEDSKRSAPGPQGRYACSNLLREHHHQPPTKNLQKLSRSPNIK